VNNNSWGFPGGSDSKESTCSAGDPGSILGWEIPWRRAWQPTPLFLPGEFHGQKSLAGYSPRVAKSQTQLNNNSRHPQRNIFS